MPGIDVPGAPARAVFIGHGESDEVISFGIGTEHVERLCRQGVDAEFADRNEASRLVADA